VARFLANSTSTNTSTANNTSDNFMPSLDSVPQDFLILILTAVSFGASLLYFGFAVYQGWTDDLAPRISNRPKNVLKNAMLYHLPSWMKHNPLWYPVAWILWAYNLTYRECLKGIPGTGTRKDGLEGPLLKANLDAVILMRFFTLLFKVSVLVCLLCIALTFVYSTAECDVEIFGNGTCSQISSENFFIRTTIDHVPNNMVNQNISQAANETLSTSDIFGIFDDSYQFSIFIGQTVRIWATVISCVLIYLYTFYLLTHEWIENINLRRKYFLEATHYSQRMGELHKMMIEHQQNTSLIFSSDEERIQQEVEADNRPEYFTHPDIRSTPPSIGIFSVIYQLPKSLVTYNTDGATTLERQLVATTNFFDEIIPPEAGFSSSVVAATILPNAKLVAKAKGKWEACEKIIQKLRYVRKRLRIARRERGEHVGNARDQWKRGVENSFSISANAKPSHRGETQEFNNTTSKKKPQQQRPTQNSSASLIRNENDSNRPSIQIAKSFKYEDFNISEYATSIGLYEEVRDMDDFVEGMGIEEFHVFAYECAKLAAAPNCNGCLFRKSGIEDLQQEEKDLLIELEEANEELKDFRKKIVEIADDDNPLEESKTTLDPMAVSDDEESIIQYYSDYEGIRKRNKGSTNTRTPSKTLPSNEEETSEKSVIQKTCDFVECLFPVRIIMRRFYYGKERHLSYREKRKYYGKSPIDPETHNGKGYVTNLERPSYAVVTFTTRRAAVIARQCMADGGSQNSWKQIDDIPIYPLADGAPLDVS